MSGFTSFKCSDQVVGFIVVWFGCFVLGVCYFIDRNFMLVIVVWSFRFGRLC